MDIGSRGAIGWCSLCFVLMACEHSSRPSSNANDAGAPSSGGSGGAGSGGMPSGGTSSGAAPTGGAGGRMLTGCGGFYTIRVNALTGDGPTEHSIAEAWIRDVDAVRELEILASDADEGGVVAFVRLVISPYNGPGTYTCSSGAATITTLQRCCPNEYDTSNPPIDECTIVVDGILRDEIIGTFEGIPHDENGGRMVLEDGRFCALIRD